MKIKRKCYFGRRNCFYQIRPTSSKLLRSRVECPIKARGPSHVPRPNRTYQASRAECGLGVSTISSTVNETFDRAPRTTGNEAAEGVYVVVQSPVLHLWLGIFRPNTPQCGFQSKLSVYGLCNSPTVMRRLHAA